ncbi:elongin-A-like isoform X2 [Protopterus annectens]|uniref:elongin-A-like isoform X2 n=1 Tax=Protopterus annectens TaxID=7888 RepID=UPI001CF9DC63|nr:elongin-A-like isoform X2 [Protopterus annectens]
MAASGGGSLKSLPANGLPALKMAESVVEIVEKLQSRLSLSQEPKKLLKTLKRLSDLPITVDILVETGIGKSVNGLRKHSDVGDYAKTLVGKWKKLVPQDEERPSYESEAQELRMYEKVNSQKRPREIEEELDYRESYEWPHDQSLGHENKKPKTTSESNKFCKSGKYGGPKEEFSSQIEDEEEEEEMDEEVDYDGGWQTPPSPSPPPPPSSHKSHKDHCSNNAKYDRVREKHVSSSFAKEEYDNGSQQKLEKVREKGYSKTDAFQVKEHKSLSKDKHQHRDKSKHFSSESQEKISKSSNRERHQQYDNKVEEKIKHSTFDFHDKMTKPFSKGLPDHKEEELISLGVSGKEKNRNTESTQNVSKRDKSQECVSSVKNKSRPFQDEIYERSGGSSKEKSRPREESSLELHGSYNKDKSRIHLEEASELSRSHSKDKSRLCFEEVSEKSTSFIKDRSQHHRGDLSEQVGSCNKDKSRSHVGNTLDQSGHYSKDKSQPRLVESLEQIRSYNKEKLRPHLEEASVPSRNFGKDKTRPYLEESSDRSETYGKEKSWSHLEESSEQSGGYGKGKSQLRLEESSEQVARKHKQKESEKNKLDSSDTVKIHSEKLKIDKERQKTQEKSKQKTKDSNEPSSKSKSSQSTEEKKSLKIATVPKIESEDVFEKPTMSFESYLSYDQPQKKKKKVSKPVGSSADRSKETSKQNDKQNNSTSESKTSSQKDHAVSSKREEKKRDKKESSPKKSKKIVIDVVPTLPDIPLPPIQPNYRPLPSIDVIPLSPPKKRSAVPIPEEEATLFTGRRQNSKMQVYSGAKISYLPRMMSLFDQCIRVLQNNVESIHEVGGVPFDILEPVLERCTPDQLFRIEDCNPVFVEDTEELWRRHCVRDFKNEEPMDDETWRDMYLRLHEERERKLQFLTRNISKAHANKPKARQVKMAFVNTEVKPPRDVRRRQEKYGTGSAAVPEKHRVKPFFSTGTSSSSSSSTSHGISSSVDSSHLTSHSSSHNSSITSTSSSSYDIDSSSYDGPSTSGGYSSSSANIASPAGQDLRKPAVKKIAPMMAKTIKIFKNRFFRR